MATVANVLIYRVPTNSKPWHESSTSAEGTAGDVYLPKYETRCESVDKMKRIKDFSSFIPFPEVLQHQTVATRRMLLWARRRKHAGLLSGRRMPCTSLLSCRQSMGCATARKWTGLTQLKPVETVPIDLIKSVQVGATDSQLLQCMDPPLGSDLHYDDK